MSATPNNRTDYTGVAKGLHWLVAIGLVGVFTLGMVMTDIPGITPTKLRLYNWHKWLGMTLLALSVARIIWRLFNPPPPLPSQTPRFQRMAATAMHHGLYVVTLAVPLLGYGHSLAAGYPVVYFGMIELPVLFGKAPEWIEPLKASHSLSAYALALAVMAHAGAAILHHFRDHDGLLLRMLPRGWLQRPRASLKE